MSEAVKGLGKEERQKQGFTTGVVRLIYMCAMALPKGQTHVGQMKPVTPEEEEPEKNRKSMRRRLEECNSSMYNPVPHSYLKHALSNRCRTAQSSSPKQAIPDSFNGSQTVRDPLEMHSMMPGSRHEHSFGRRSQLARSELYMQPRSLMVLLFQPKFTGQLSLSLRIKFLMRVCKSLFLLITLVKEYCATLGSSSVYSALLEPSLSVMRWSGYIRDNGAALTTDHH